MQSQISGLTLEEVKRRQESGEGGNTLGSVTKTNGQIFKENICTLFNLLNFIIAVMLFLVKAYSNMFFFAIILLNAGIGIAQELKAKKMVDRLSILNQPQITVLREGKEAVVKIEEVVQDDVIVLESGRQICNDAQVLSGTLEVNESLLTGESDAIVKEEGAFLYSGSSVISGKCYAKVLHVGAENYASKLAQEVKQEKKTQSELLSSMEKVTHFTSFLIIPLGILLFLQAVLFRNAGIESAVVTSAAALLGMLPKGLVLLISVSLAAGVIRLAKNNILVQNIYSLETLAQIDVLCLDKTGTITDGKMKVKEILAVSKQEDIEQKMLLQSYLNESNDNNATIEALRNEITPKQFFQPIHKISFSSIRKWGAVSFKEKGTVFLGAPERIFKDKTLLEKAEKQMELGYRVIAVGISSQSWQEEKTLPEDISPLYFIVLEDSIRSGTAETLEYFRKEGVDVKVISGDHAKTVSMIAQKAGLLGWEKVIDLSTLGETIDYDKICQEYSVFARVTPKQKQFLVQALKRQGHRVAMTGDGVNDLLALKEADCAIAVSEGSDASRQISQIVLLDSNFTYLSQVVLEGRRVINNVTRTAGVFFIKTIYSVLVSVLCLLLNIPFPFIPIQITLVDACMEAYPSFFTIFENNTRRIKGSFLKKALKNAAPFAVIIAGMITVISISAPFSQPQNQTLMYLLLIVITMASVIKSCIPFSKLRSFICITMVAGTILALFLFPNLLQIVPLTLPGIM